MVTKLRRGLFSLICVFAVFLVVSYHDLKKERVVHRTVQEVVNEETENKNGRPIHILTLGGSNTWGAGLPSRDHAFPFRLQKDNQFIVTNLALRGTGSDYPAQCMSTMLKSHAQDPNSPYDPKVPFDVIILEFSVNGMEKFELLVRRIRERYPDAILIYVNLWSLSLKENGYRGAFDSTEAIRLVKEANGYVYDFHHRGNAHEIFHHHTITSDDLSDADITDLFGGDRHHLSFSGHDLVRTKVSEIIYAQDIPDKPRLGSWLGGDHCQSWYETGETTLTIADGGTMNEWDQPKHKWAIEVDQNGAVLEYMNDNGEHGQFSLQFMAKCDDMNDGRTSKYPPVLVMIGQSNEEIEEAKELAKYGRLQLQLDSGFEGGKVLNDPEGRWKYLSPLHSRVHLRQFHVTESRVIGNIHPGHNFIFVYPLRKTEYPYRITATVYCAACTQLGIEG